MAESFHHQKKGVKPASRMLNSEREMVKFLQEASTGQLRCLFLGDERWLLRHSDTFTIVCTSHVARKRMILRSSMGEAAPVGLIVFPLAIVLQPALEAGHTLALTLVVAPAACIGVAVAAGVCPLAVPQIGHGIALPSTW